MAQNLDAAAGFVAKSEPEGTTMSNDFQADFNTTALHLARTTPTCGCRPPLCRGLPSGCEYNRVAPALTLAGHTGHNTGSGEVPAQRVQQGTRRALLGHGWYSADELRRTAQALDQADLVTAAFAAAGTENMAAGGVSG